MRSLAAAFSPASDLLQFDPVCDGSMVHGDGELGLGSGQVCCGAAVAELTYGLRDGVIDGVRPHLNLMLDVVGIGEGNDAAAEVHTRQHRRRESEVEWESR